MKKRKNEQGFAMLEVVVVMMIFMMLASMLYGLAGMEHRRTLSRVSEDEAYYAAISAVRLMAQEVVNGDAEEGTAADRLVRGMKKRSTKLVFEPENGKDVVEIPVSIWSKRDGEYLLLSAEAKSEEETRLVTIRLIKRTEPSEAIPENQHLEATASDAESAEEIHWVPVSYTL